ncbi:hypothetical protein CspHIS471_0608490 [Cutaneotrichosporon sp. HIS471]|nr:hypothetical protein CspHIS471_0608490 [Cutaneotrichosporon sp. HIS471]
MGSCTSRQLYLDDLIPGNRRHHEIYFAHPYEYPEGQAKNYKYYQRDIPTMGHAPCSYYNNTLRCDIIRSNVGVNPHNGLPHHYCHNCGKSYDNVWQWDLCFKW